MAVDPVTPIPGNASQVVTAGTPVIAVNPGPNGGFITNPYLAADQGFDPADPPENLYVNVVTAATQEGNDTTVCLYPGQTMPLIPGQTTPTSVNSKRSGHKFTVTSY